MGFFRSSCSITRFVIAPEGFSKHSLLNLPEKLQQYSFIDIDDTLEERAWGWTNIDDMLDTKWSISPPEKGEYIAFALRLETRRIPPGVLKKHLAIALRKEQMDAQALSNKDKSGYRERRRAIQDSVHRRLLKSFLPIPAIFDVAWNTHTNIVYFASIDTKVIHLFSNYFTLTFDISLVQQTPYNLANVLLTDKSTKIDQVTYAKFV